MRVFFYTLGYIQFSLFTSSFWKGRRTKCITWPVARKAGLPSPPIISQLCSSHRSGDRTSRPPDRPTSEETPVATLLRLSSALRCNWGNPTIGSGILYAVVSTAAADRKHTRGGEFDGVKYPGDSSLVVPYSLAVLPYNFPTVAQHSTAGTRHAKRICRRQTSKKKLQSACRP